MASTYTNLGVEKPGSGDYSNTWDTPANRNYDLLDDSISGVTQIAIADANTTLTVPDATSSANRKMVIEFTGTLTANRTITFAPADLTRMVVVTNSTTGGFSLTFQQGAAAATYTLANAKSTVIYMDGSDEVRNALANLAVTSLTATTVAATNLTVAGANAVPDTRTITVAGGGLAGGGDLTANRVITLDVNTMAEDTAPDMDADFIAGYDASGAANAKVRMVNYVPQIQRTGANIASAATLLKPADADIGLFHTITGTTTIANCWNEAVNRLLIVSFAGILSLTHSATLVLPGAANITTAVGDRAFFYGQGGGTWICVGYIPINGQPFVQIATAGLANDSVTYPKIQNVSAASRLLGRGSAAGAGDVEEIIPGSGLAFSGTTLNATGKLAQVVRAINNTYSNNGGALIPNDNTIPQISEGGFVMQVQITPLFASSAIRIRFNGMFGSSATGIGSTVAMFKDANVNAIDAKGYATGNSVTAANPTLDYKEAAGDTLLHTYSVRVGATSGTVYINGDASARFYGGVGACSLEAEEILA